MSNYKPQSKTLIQLKFDLIICLIGLFIVLVTECKAQEYEFAQVRELGSRMIYQFPSRYEKDSARVYQSLLPEKSNIRDAMELMVSRGWEIIIINNDASFTSVHFRRRKIYQTAGSKN
jgi:hypothetical protein